MDISIGARGTQSAYGFQGAEMPSGVQNEGNEGLKDKEVLTVDTLRKGVGVEPPVGPDVEQACRRDDDLGQLFKKVYDLPPPEMSFEGLKG